MYKVYHDDTYLELVDTILKYGRPRYDRTGVGTIGMFAEQMRFNLTGNSIPLLTTKKMHTKSVIHEILWYLQGNTNIKYLNDNGVRIWNEWADEDGDLGPVYGAQWRRWPKYEIEEHQGEWADENDPSITKYFNALVRVSHIDQIANVIDQIRNNPYDRRIIVNAWNVSDLEQMALPPCHYAMQFYVSDGTLSCMLNQRSADVGLGIPFNVVQYSILTHMIAHVTGLTAGDFIWSGGDVHIYNNHVDKLKEQLERESFPSPRLILNPDVKEIDDFKFEDFEIVDYRSHPTIKMQVAI